MTDELRLPALQLFLEDQILGHELTGFKRLPDDQQQVFRLDRFLEEVEGSVLHGLHRRLDRPVSRHHHDRHHWIFIFQPLEHL